MERPQLSAGGAGHPRGGHLILGKSYRQIAQEQDVDKSVVRRSVKRGIAAMKKYLKKVL